MPNAAASARAACDVPGCRRTIRCRDFPEHHNRFLCAKHWQLVPKGLKRAKARHEREYRRYGFYPRENAYFRIMRAAWRLAGAEIAD